MLVALLLVGCTPRRAPFPPAEVGAGATGARPLLPSATVGSDRISGTVVPRQAGTPSPVREAGRPIGAPVLPAGVAAGQGDVSLDFVDVDVREVVRFILGEVLAANYTIDTSVQGTVTIQTARPLPADALLPTLQALLGQVGATMVFQDGLYRVVPILSLDTSAPLVGGSSPVSGSEVVRLRYAMAARLATVLLPFVPDGGRLVPDPATNSLVVSGTGDVRSTLVALIRSFDVNTLAGQAYALYPVPPGDATLVAADLQRVLEVEAEGDLVGVVKVIPIERANAVLVLSPQQAYLDRAGRLLRQIAAFRDSTSRRLRVYYPSNVQATDLQPVLARLFIAQAQGPGLPGAVTPAAEAVQLGATGPGGAATRGDTPTLAGTRTLGGTAATGLQGTAGGLGVTGLATEPDTGLAAAGPALLAGGAPGQLQIVADGRRNALLVVASDEEYGLIDAVIAKLDILPRQVLIEATIAEVSLNDALRYGTQFFFQRNGFGAILANGLTGGAAAAGTPFGGAVDAVLPNFAVGRTTGSAQFIIQALNSITDVKVVSSPQVLILENERARLQVGDLVPILTQTSTSVISADAPVVNNVEYRETGVILNVTPRVNSGDLVTLDIEQEVSDVVATTSSDIDSPTFQQRRIKSRVVVQDGETISLGGLIRETAVRSNSGIPFLQDIPVLGALFSTTDNSRDRTELLVLITPRVVRDQRDARAVTEELRRKLAPGALFPASDFREGTSR